MKNIGDAFSFPFKDPNWLSKFIVGTVFSMLSILLIGIPVTYGYCIELLQRVRNNEPYPLPEWNDIGVKFVVGFKYLMVLLMYNLPILLVVIPMVFMIFATVFALGGSDITGFFVLPYVIVFAALVVPYGLFINLITPVISIEYARTESIGDGVKVGTVLSLFKRHWQDVLVATLITIGIGSLAGLGLLIFIIGVFTAAFYVHLVSFHLYGQLAQTIHGASAPSKPVIL